MLGVDIHSAHRHATDASHEHDPVLPLQDRAMPRGENEGLQWWSRELDVQNLAVQWADRDRPVHPRFRLANPRSRSENDGLTLNPAGAVLDADDRIASANEPGDTPEHQ